MAGAALVVGWGPVVRGREQQAFQVFDEAIQYYTQLQQQGEIDSFEPVALEPHGGELAGFLLVRGDRATLERLRFSDEFMRLNDRASSVVDNFGVVSAFIGEELNRWFANIQQNTADLTGQS